MQIGRMLRPVTLTAVALLVAAGVACSSDSAAPNPTPTSLPTLEATVAATPIPARKPVDTPTAVAYPTATPTVTVTSVPPTPTAAPPPTYTPFLTVTASPPTPTPTATPIASFTQEQLRQKLSSLEEILRTEEPTLDADGRDYKGYAQKVQDIFEAGYYLTSGKTPQQHNIEVKILMTQDFDKFVDEHQLSSALKRSAGFTYTTVDFLNQIRQYKRTLVIDGGEKPVFVLDTVVHEGGHALAGALNPKLKSSNLASAALSESQAYTFEAAFNRTIDSFTDKLVLQYLKTNGNIEFILANFAVFEDAVRNPISLDTTHDIGKVLPWIKAKGGGMLKLGSQLSAAETYQLFLDLVMTPKDDADAEIFVNNLLAQANPNLDFIKQHALSRLKDSNEREGPDLFPYKDTALLRP